MIKVLEHHQKEMNLTTINKGVFTYKKRDGCPPWKIKSREIQHDRTKRQIEYKMLY